MVIRAGLLLRAEGAVVGRRRALAAQTIEARKEPTHRRFLENNTRDSGVLANESSYYSSKRETERQRECDSRAQRGESSLFTSSSLNSNNSP
jgi:hypothetical protein